MMVYMLVLRRTAAQDLTEKDERLALAKLLKHVVAERSKVQAVGGAIGTASQM